MQNKKIENIKIGSNIYFLSQYIGPICASATSSLPQGLKFRLIRYRPNWIDTYTRSLLSHGQNSKENIINITLMKKIKGWPNLIK